MGIEQSVLLPPADVLTKVRVARNDGKRSEAQPSHKLRLPLMQMNLKLDTLSRGAGANPPAPAPVNAPPVHGQPEAGQATMIGHYQIGKTVGQGKLAGG